MKKTTGMATTKTNITKTNITKMNITKMSIMKTIIRTKNGKSADRNRKEEPQNRGCVENAHLLFD